MNQRLAWLDLFRGACVVWMIETHVFNTFLATPLRDTAWFWWLNYFNGLIAPGFLFIAGIGQGLGMRLSEGPRKGWGKRVRRLLGVWLLGYALHFPGKQIFAGHWAEAIRLGTPVDVLPCLAVSIGLLLAFERLARRWVDALALATLVLVVFVWREEIVASWRFSPSWLLAYVNRSTGSLFPLIPWLGFVCAGFLASGLLAALLYHRHPAKVVPVEKATSPEMGGRGGRFLPALVGRPLVALTLVVVGLVVGLTFWAPGSAGFFFQRLSWLFAAVPLAMTVSGIWQPSALLFAGRQSLVLYAVHLVVIEILAALGVPRNALDAHWCVLLFPAVTLASAALTLGWVRLWKK